MNAEIRLGKVRKALEQEIQEATNNGNYRQLMVYKSLWVECLDPTNIIDQLAHQSLEKRIHKFHLENLEI